MWKSLFTSSPLAFSALHPWHMLRIITSPGKEALRAHCSQKHIYPHSGSDTPNLPTVPIQQLLATSNAWHKEDARNRKMNQVQLMSSRRGQMPTLVPATNSDIPPRGSQDCLHSSARSSFELHPLFLTTLLQYHQQENHGNLLRNC